MRSVRKSFYPAAMSEAEPTVGEYTIKPLGPDTWEAFALLAERHNGVWNGCWYTWFHASCAERGVEARTAKRNRALSRRMFWRTGKTCDPGRRGSVSGAACPRAVGEGAGATGPALQSARGVGRA